MATRNKPTWTGRGRDSYLQNVIEFPLVSIRTQRQFVAAQKVLDRLLAKGRLDPGEALYLDALADLVATYEDEHHAIAPASDAEMLRYLMDARAITQVELSQRTRIAKSTISEVLAGKKPFSRQMIRKFAKYFQVDVGILAANL